MPNRYLEWSVTILAESWRDLPKKEQGLVLPTTNSLHIARVATQTLSCGSFHYSWPLSQTRHLAEQLTGKASPARERERCQRRVPESRAFTAPRWMVPAPLVRVRRHGATALDLGFR